MAAEAPSANRHSLFENAQAITTGALFIALACDCGRKKPRRKAAVSC